ncbi:hypothetical protein PF005_g8354 [Phytophthora fragariae]|uniref:Uncharacterized protein n=1 Tax=Phytophthora fragariae TaxID=53985 RepID=A0A6A3U8P3_9STRA|nr:hypothetical protein PF003_g2085 [Phytophthora fragariae]KAE9119178.1 hypothetical protein PF007_g8647 [Phytophthora fragariae]KAE9147754.1 hypothetical protein PF006_g7590 [Phytophthora fragariae]KAE9218203.1 hypothetical protein PF005_g8354 [Phytophthora fragariae]KAE9316135.1 hypothetical protein PF001_g7454 [Phytophthora fragariae]
MSGSKFTLHLRQVDDACKIALGLPANVLKVEWVDYVLQVAAGTNSGALNATELVDKLTEVRALCAKSRSGLMAKVGHELSVPFEPAELVPVIRPDALAVVMVPRQHALDCTMNGKAKKGASMFVAPPKPSRTKDNKRKVPSRGGGGRPPKRHKHLSDLSSDESDGELMSSP